MSHNSQTMGTIMKTGCIQRMCSICPPISLTQKWRIGISNQTANDVRGDCVNTSMMRSCKCAALLIFTRRPKLSNTAGVNSVAEPQSPI